MKREPLTVRGLVLMVIGGLVLSSTGCVTGERRAARSQNRIAEGMSRDDVEAALGGADSQELLQGREIWHYSYAALPDPAKMAEVGGQSLALITVVGGIFLLIAYASRGKATPGSDAFDRLFPSAVVTLSRVHFRVVFDRTGRVVEISGIEPCDED